MEQKKIDCIDISRFPKYYLELKKAAIMSLSLEEYIRFFVPEIEEQEHINDITEKYKNKGMYKELVLKLFFTNNIPNTKVKRDLSEMYYALNSNLSSENKIFWDELVKLYNPYTIYQSELFRKTDIKAIYQIITGNYCNAIYLKDEDTYNDLRSKIVSCTVNHHIGNIFQEIDNFNDSYDLVNLSNIIDYSSFFEYRQLLDKFNLTSTGIVLSYIYCLNLDDRVEYEFRDKTKYKFKKLPTENIMIYKK